MNFSAKGKNMNSQRGYIALASVIVMSAVILLTVITVTFLSVAEGQSALGHQKNADALSFVEGCVEETLSYLSDNDSLPTTVSLPSLGTCQITENSHVDDTWDFTVEGSLDNYSKKINLQAERTTTVIISQWQEIE